MSVSFIKLGTAWMILNVAVAAAQEQAAQPPVVIQNVIDDPLPGVKPNADDEESLIKTKIAKEIAIEVEKIREKKRLRYQFNRLLFEDPEIARLRVSEAGVDEIDDDVPVVDPLPLRDRVYLPEDYFEATVFGSREEVRQWPKRMEHVFAIRLEVAEIGGPLSQTEIAKLKLAGKGDVKHLQNEVDEARRQFDQTERTRSAMAPHIENLSSLHIQILGGPFGDDSLFIKTLEGIRRKQREASADLKNEP